VVHVTPSLDMMHPSGIDVHVYELARSLLSRGEEVAVYTSLNCGRKDLSQAEFHRFPIYGVSDLPFLVKNIETFRTLIKRAWLPIHTRTFFDELTREHDIVHIHGHEYPISFVAMLAAKKAGIPTVLTIHGVERGLEHMPSFLLLRKATRPTFFSFVVNSANAVVAPSDQVLQILERYRPKRVVRIPHGISLERFRGLEKGSDYVLYLGRLFPVKGPEIFVKAASLISKRVDIKFLMVGYGSQRPCLEKLVKTLGISNKVKFVDSVPYDEVPKIMAGASVFVAPGISGYSLLEAASAGVPIVSGSIGWNISCIGRNSAIYVNPQDAKELAEAVVRILTDENLAKDLSSKARRFVESHRNWNTLIGRYIEVYNSILQTT